MATFNTECSQTINNLLEDIRKKCCYGESTNKTHYYNFLVNLSQNNNGGNKFLKFDDGTSDYNNKLLEFTNRGLVKTQKHYAYYCNLKPEVQPLAAEASTGHQTSGAAETGSLVGDFCAR